MQIHNEFRFNERQLEDNEYMYQSDHILKLLRRTIVVLDNNAHIGYIRQYIQKSDDSSELVIHDI